MLLDISLQIIYSYQPERYSWAFDDCLASVRFQMHQNMQIHLSGKRCRLKRSMQHPVIR
jgi:hypothetical protein